MSRRARRTLAVLVSAALAAGVSLAPGTGSRASPHRASAARSRQTTSQDLFAALAGPPRDGTFGGGAWCWFQDPRAVSAGGLGGKAFAGWIARNGNITIGVFSASAGVQTHVIGHAVHDDHASPALLLERDGRVTAFWSHHNGHTMNYRTTLRPEDIGAWGPVKHVHSTLAGHLGFTYPNPVMLPREGNKLYLFWRGADWDTDYATRSASGHWGSARELISLPGQRPYLKVAGNGRDEIALAFNDAHPGYADSRVYYAVYRDGSLWTASGRRIIRLGGEPMAPSQAQLVYDGLATGVPSWVWDVAFDGHDRPVIVYATFPSARNHAYWYAHWNGKRWVLHLLTFAGPTISPRTIETYYSGGIALDHTDPSILYLSRKVGRRFRIERWSTRDGGYHWSDQVVVSGSSDALRPVLPRGSSSGPLSLLWMSGHYGSYIRYRTSIKFRTT